MKSAKVYGLLGGGAKASMWLALSVALAACGKKGEGAEVRPVDERAPVEVTAGVVVARSLPRALDATGSLVADQQSDLTSIVPGRVTDVYVERGSVVEEGAPLMKLRDVDYRLQMAAAQASLSQARARLGITGDTTRVTPEETPEARAAAANRELADRSLERAERVGASGGISAAELDQARAQATAAREQYNAALNAARAALATLESARVMLAQGRNAVRDSLVRAPFSGEIADRFVDVGEYVSPQTRVVSLVRTDPLRLEMQVPQERAGNVRRGQVVRFRVDASPDRVFQAQVRYISAAVRPDTRALMVEAVVSNTDGALRPGMFASAQIALEGEAPAFAVPATALLTEAGIHRVFVIQGNKIEERVVVVAEREGDTILLSSGVRAGERVATRGLESLGDGAAVRVTQ